MRLGEATAWTLGILAAGAVGLGCIVSPVPEPPAVVATLVTVELVSTNPDDPDALPDTAIVRGEAGAVSQRVGDSVANGEALIRVVNLDLTEEPREVAVAPDGSFSASLAGRPGDLFRLRAFADELWSSPVDVLIPPETGPVTPLPDPTSGSCLSIRAPAVLDFGAVALGDIAVEVIVIENECAAETSIEVMTLRIGETETNCDENYQVCINSSDDGTIDDPPSTCSEPYTLCMEGCRTEREECLSAGGTDQECDVLSLDCEDRCSSDYSVCIENTCSDQLRTCEETPYEQPQGFSVHTGAMPLTVPPGASRSVVVTFTPPWLGLAEDTLLLWFDIDAQERMAISLIGQGVP